MNKIIIVLFVLSITLLAAVKGSLWYVTQEFVDDQIFQAKPLVEISYKELKTSFTGSATITGVKVYIPDFDENINIESISLIAPDLKTLLTLNNKFQHNELPEFLTLVISGASLGLNSKIMKVLDNPDIEPTQLEIFSTLACGDIHRIGSSALTKMGYDSLTSDIILSYQFNPKNNSLKYDLRTNIRDITNLNFSGTLHGVTNLKSLIDQKSRPGQITLEILDDSYIERKNRFCSAQGEYQVSEYINKHILQVEEYLLSYGVEPEEGLLNAYKNVLETSSSVTFEANLINLTGTTELMSFEPNDIIQFIHLKLFVDDKRINEISIHIDKEKLIKTATSDELEIETPDAIKKKQAIIIKKYRAVSASNLQNFNGFRVKIETNKGKHYRGAIKTDNPRIYEVITRLRSGYISYFIPVNTIKKAEVFN